MYSVRSKMGKLSLTSCTSTRIVRFDESGGSPESVAVTINVWRCEVSKSRCCDKVRWPVVASMLKRLLADMPDEDEIEFDVTRFAFDERIEPPVDKR